MTKQLGTEKLSSLFIKFTIPSIIGMTFVGIQGIIDGLFVGNIIGDNALASVNLAQPYLQILMAVALIISIGAQSIIGITLGKGERKEAQNIFRTALILLCVLSILITILSMGYSEQIARLLGANDILLEATSTYIRTISFFSLFLTLMFLTECLVRTIGKPNVSLISMVVSVVLNIVLDYILIKELNMGVQGAALATGISYSLALLINVIPFFNKKEVINVYSGSFEKNAILPMMYNGSSEGVSSVSTAFSMFLFNTALMKLAGANGIAAFSIINYIAQVGYMILFGIADGIRPIISYNYGAKKFHRVNTLMIASIVVNTVIGGIIFAVMSLFSEPLIHIFLKDGKDVLDIAADGAKIYGIAFLFNGINILLSSYFTAIDNALYSILIAASRGIIFILIGICTLPYFFGIHGIWAIIVFAEVITLLLCHRLVKKQPFLPNAL